MNESSDNSITVHGTTDNDVEQTRGGGKTSEYAQVGVSYGFVIATAVVVALAALADVAVLRAGEAVSGAILAASAIVTMAATIVIAKFTQRLFDATDDIRKSGDATIRVMAAQQRAMEKQVTAMERVAESIAESAVAAKESARIITRMFAAQHPPALRIDAWIQDDDGDAITIKGGIWNDGGTDATIKTTYMHDAVYRIADPTPKADAIQNDPELVGAKIQSHRRLDFTFKCQDIKKSDLRPNTWGPIAIALGVTRPPEDKPKLPTLHFGGFLTFVNEGDRFEMIDINLTCDPASRRFEKAT